MRAMARSASIGILLLGLVSHVCPQGKSKDATPTEPGQSQWQSKPARGVLTPDPDQIWNRLFRLFYVRHARDGREYGGDELDPYLWPETKYLLSGPSHEEALKSLDEFLQQHSERLIAEPLKRALFQRDLLAVSDWLSLPRDEPVQPRSELQKRVTEIIRRLALTKDQTEK